MTKKEKIILLDKLVKRRPKYQLSVILMMGNDGTWDYQGKKFTDEQISVIAQIEQKRFVMIVNPHFSEVRNSPKNSLNSAN